MLRALRQWGAVDLAARWSRAKLAEAWIEGVTALDGESPEFARLFVPHADEEVGGPLHERLASVDRLISFVSDGRDAWAVNAATMAEGAARFFVRPRPGPRDPIEPIPTFHQQQLAGQGLAYEPVGAPARGPIVDGPVVLHPGSGGVRKCWPRERWEALGEHLEAIGRPVAVVLGEAERERWPPAAQRAWRERFDCYMPGSPLDLSKLIFGAGVFVGNDAGPTHLAAQLGVPTVALFGPTDPRIWGPTGPSVRIVAPDEPRPMDWLDVATVGEAIAGW